MPVEIMKPRCCGKSEIATLPPACQCCGLRVGKLFDAFVNGQGWKRLCGKCLDPERGPPRAYTGPYPVTRHHPARPHLHIVGGAAR